jgi:hypothetical protein
METKHIAALLVLALITGEASGWGVETHEYVCEQAVSGSWGVQAVEQCLTYNRTLQDALCDRLRQDAGDAAYGRCVLETGRGVFLHPAVIPDVIFNDSSGKYDYSRCPVKGRENQELVCGDPDVRPAVDNSERWFVKSMNADDLCLRVAYFCIASNYYADSDFKPNNVRNLKMCYGDVEGEIDGIVRSNDSWSINDYCSFEGWVQKAGRTVRERHEQTFTYTSADVKGIIENLTARAEYIKTVPFVRDIAPQTTAVQVQETLPCTTSTTAATVPAAEAADETEMTYSEFMEDINSIFNESYDILTSLENPENASEEQQSRGQGNIIINTFMIIFALAGAGICAVVYFKTERKRREKKARTTPPTPNSPRTPTSP